MGRDDAGSIGVEFLDVESPDPAAPADRTRLWSRWVAALAATMAAVAAIAALTGHRGAPATEPSTPPVSRNPTAMLPQPVAVAPVSITSLRHPLLGVTAGWELFGRGDGFVIHVLFARGRVTRTVVPALASTGPVWFVLAHRQALIRPIDLVPGYIVANGAPARPMPATLADSGPMLPGPDPRHVWVAPDSGRTEMVLVGVDGTRTGTTVRLPAASSPLDAISDGAGYVLVASSTGVVDARPDGPRRLSTGSLIAAGPTGWLVAESYRQHARALVLIDRASGRRRLISAAAPDALPAGLIAPDGRTAMIFVVTTVVTPYLVGLRNGAARFVPLRHLSIDLSSDATIAWSPDSRWLFAVDTSGQLHAIDARTGRVSVLDAALPRLRQLVVTRGGAR